MKPVNMIADGVEANMALTAPGCGDLPVLRSHDAFGTPQMVSRWRLSFFERIKVLLFGDMWLGVITAESQPPVYLTVDNPVFIAFRKPMIVRQT